MKRKKQIYLTVYISPAGAKYTTFELTYKKPNPAHWTRGEGNCLVFRLVDGDYSTNFYEALENGTIMDQIGNFHIEGSIDIKKISEDKKEFLVKVEEMKEKYGWS